MDWDYLQAVKEAMVDQDVILRHKDLNIVYSPMHGTGRVIIPEALRSWGFQNIHVVPEQMVIDGNFPTVVSPNPENAEAMTLGMKLGTRLNADLVIASDPDADRLAIVCRNSKGEWEILNGNQTCMMFSWYIIANKKKLGQLKGNEFLVKTIVTTEVIAEIAKKNGVELRDCYTGFKWIANEIRISEGKQKYIGGGEESFGFLPFDKVRDKDSPASICLICEIAAWAKDNGMTLYDLLMNIYAEYGFSKEVTINVVKPGKSGADEIKQMMVLTSATILPRTWAASLSCCGRTTRHWRPRRLTEALRRSTCLPPPMCCSGSALTVPRSAYVLQVLSPRSSSTVKSRTLRSSVPVATSVALRPHWKRSRLSRRV